MVSFRGEGAQNTEMTKHKGAQKKLCFVLKSQEQLSDVNDDEDRKKRTYNMKIDKTECLPKGHIKKSVEKH